ncbi:MAG: phosphoribosylformylglycinamidine synthase, partial [Lachnospiraceae bacterium]|nr:phosphoribosylformylglycinamidine synthase [Lachnospiraceae bacterium]
EYAVAARELISEIKNYLNISSVDRVRVLIRYDVENISDETYNRALKTVFSEPPVDDVIEEKLDTKDAFCFSVEYLPGQYDQRADSAEQCIKFLNEKENPVIKTAVTYMVYGSLDDKMKAAIKAHCINPVDSRETSLDKPDTLITHYDEPADVHIFEGFKDMADKELKELYDSLSLAMTYKDFLHIQNYFKNEEKRDPSMTEIRVLDTYWSDHCRHTTFSTELKNIDFEEGFYNKPIKESFENYKKTMSDMYKGRDDKYICLMDIALMAMKKLKKDGFLQDQEESDEINACSIVVPVKVDGKEEEWLVSFKNETHNHPTEIEPFGGAATCLGGAIRDPLSGRSYVYQAMRITGAADPTVPVRDTLEGKLPQRKIVTSAAAGYSSYGNQIGLATGYVKEIYHPNYVAKRMEVGAVMGASPRRCVKRLTSDPGDVIILLGGKTGRDGCGGATGSSKVHTTESITTCGAEVQKGNAPTERKIQRLFRREEVASLIKKCNDFGAGGVSVAIGELADGLNINLDKVPKKYAGLDGTELAISESQERMAVVVDPKDVDAFLKYAAEENLEATIVAEVTKEPRLVLNWRGKEIVNLSRAFLDTNGAHQETDVKILMPDEKKNYFKVDYKGDVKELWLKTLSDLNECSQKGLVERFDSSIGAGTELMPYGGKYQLTETQAMVAHLPLLKGKTDTVTMMSYGFNPYISSWSPYHGAIYSVTDSIAKIVATGGDYKKIRFSFQEYFKRMTGEPERYSEPVSALLGAYDAQIGYKLPSIGGKDSMSGTFNDIDVPPTLISFAVDVAKEGDIVSPELKEAGDALLLFRIKKDEYDVPVYEQVMKVYDYFHKLVCEGKIKASYALDGHGIAAAVSKMGFGNKIGADIYEEVARETVFGPGYGNIIAEVSGEYLDEIVDSGMAVHVGETCEEQDFFYEDANIPMEEAITAWRKPLLSVFPERAVEGIEPIQTKLYEEKNIYVCKNKVAKPHVFIPVFPGTNCEYDSAKAFERAGATVTTKVFLNQTEEDIRESVEVYKNEIANAQIVMFPGGFSAGDEPDGSAKFFATAFRNEVLKEEINKLIKERDGLVLGICNGFQALIKLGLVPCGEVTTQTEDSPTLTYNTIGRHISKIVYTKVVSNKSPWLQNAKLGGVYAIPASHGEGRFVANKEWLNKLIANGQVATQYVDINGNASMDEEWNVNGSYMAIEGITSPDGRVFGKMAHAERRGDYVAINIYGNQDMQIFESGVKYFK